MGMLSVLTKVIKPLLYRLFGPHFITWSWSHQKKVLKASILIAQMMIKLGVSTAKIKYSTQIYMIDQNVSHLCFVMSFVNFFTRLWSPDLLNACQSGLTQKSLTTWFGQNARKESDVAKADLLFLFANPMKWGSTWKKERNFWNH